MAKIFRKSPNSTLFHLQKKLPVCDNKRFTTIGLP